MSLQKELAHLQLPQRNPVGSISATLARGQALSLDGSAHDQIQRVLSKIQIHSVYTPAQWGIPSTILTLTVPRDRALTPSRVPQNE